MSFIAWFFIGYGVVAMLAVRPIAGALAWRMCRIEQAKYPSLYGRRGRTEPTGEQWLGGIAAALCIVCLWPVAVVFILQGRTDSWTLGAERLARLEERERRVQKLEEELGVR